MIHLVLREALMFDDYVYLYSYVTLTYASLFFYFLTFLMNPGFVDPMPQNETDINLNIELKSIMVKIKSRFCETCELEQPLRSRHCESCDRCVNKFDHHWYELAAFATKVFSNNN